MGTPLWLFASCVKNKAPCIMDLKSKWQNSVTLYLEKRNIWIGEIFTLKRGENT